MRERHGKARSWEGETLRICLLTYRGNPASGGQGVYIRHLSKALAELGHQVEIVSGPPYPELHDHLPLIKLAGLDLYNPEHLFKVKDKKDLFNILNLYEYITMCTGGFPEPFTFGWRVYRSFRRFRPAYDIVHDNQCLSYGVWALKTLGYPLVTTIHHPVTVDRKMDLLAAASLWKKIGVRRWYSFLSMQKRVARRIGKIVTVSEASKKDISRQYGVNPDAIRVVMNGIDTGIFRPLPEIARDADHLIATNSADTPLKGMGYLLEAIAEIRKKRAIKLTVVGQPKVDGYVENLVRRLGLRETVRFTGRIEPEQFSAYYARATMAVIPSLYEGFGLPAGEAMSCGVPVVSTSGGALTEVVGDAGLIVPPGDAAALAAAITTLLDNPDLRLKLGQAGLARVRKLFSWRVAAEKTVAVYREAMIAND